MKLQMREAPARKAREPLKTTERSLAKFLRGGGSVGRLRIGRGGRGSSGLLVGLLVGLLCVLGLLGGLRGGRVLRVGAEGNEGECSGEGGSDRADHRVLLG